MDSNLYHAAEQLVQRDGGSSRIAQLYALAVSPCQPQAVHARLRNGLLLVAALLLASGLIFWIAANWQDQTRMFKLGLIEGALALSLGAALLVPALRMAGLLCATLVLGGLLAFVGQTYQTGADAWQLFAVWAALSIIWVGLARSDVLWTLWIAIAATGVAMWFGRLKMWDLWFRAPDAVQREIVCMALLLALAAVPWAVSRIAALRLPQGMGWWSHRLALGLALAAWVLLGILDLFDERVSSQGIGFAVSGALIAFALWVSHQSRLKDFSSLCLCVLAANVWLIALAVRLMLQNLEHDWLGMLFLLTVLGLGCLGGSVTVLLAVQRRWRASAAAQGGAQ